MTNVLRLFADPAPVVEPSRFEELWKVWPKKDGKAIARAKFEAIVKGGFRSKTLDKSSGQFMELELSAATDQIITGAKAYLQSQKKTGSGNYGYKDDGKFIPHLATWLGRAGWEDWT